ncbi:MAG: hypothetical protein GX684_01830 [Ruminococcaceae bacterium]|nr:hypothetical protein [Oscillospiraceae bacterium]
MAKTIDLKPGFLEYLTLIICADYIDKNLLMDYYNNIFKRHRDVGKMKTRRLELGSFSVSVVL